MAGPFYHGTKADLKPGDLIVPGYRSNYAHGKRTSAWVYFSAILSAWAAELAQGDGPGRIYVVEPTGPFEDDPDLTDKKFPGNPTKSYRSRAPLRVVEEVTGWQGHSPEEIKAMTDALARHQANQTARIAGIPTEADFQQMYAQADASARAWAEDAVFNGGRLMMLIRGVQVTNFASMRYRSARTGDTHTIELPQAFEAAAQPHADDAPLSGRITDIAAWRDVWAAVIESCITEIGLSVETRLWVSPDAAHDTLRFFVESDGSERAWQRRLHLVRGVLTDAEQGQIWDFAAGSFSH